MRAPASAMLPQRDGPLRRLAGRAALTAGCVLVGLLVAGCRPRTHAADRRESYFSGRPGHVVVGVAWPGETDLFHKGIALAVAEVNRAHPAPALRTRRIPLPRLTHRHFGDPASEVTALRRFLDAGRQAVTAVSRQKETVAVVGHLNSDLAAAASITYQMDRVAAIFTGATMASLTRRKMNAIFRLNASTRTIADELVTYVAEAGHEKPLVVYERSLEGRELAYNFMSRYRERGHASVDSIPYNTSMVDFRPIFAFMEELTFDVILLPGVLPNAPLFIEQARGKGFAQPILVTEGVYDELARRPDARRFDGVVTVRHFNPNLDNAATRRFVREFEARHGARPDSAAALGYDAIQVIARALHAAGGSLARFRDNLQYTDDLTSVSGAPIAFDDFRDNEHPGFFFYQMTNGRSSLVFSAPGTREGGDAEAPASPAENPIPSTERRAELSDRELHQ